MYYISRTARDLPANAVRKVHASSVANWAGNSSETSPPTNEPQHPLLTISAGQSILINQHRLGMPDRLVLMSVGWCDKLTAPRLTRANSLGSLDDDTSTNINTQLRRSTNAPTPLPPFFAGPLLSSSPCSQLRFYYSLQR
ncbi:unnamed protein product [Clonostachys solani]|uniref:Uncharacterized protein n=1 Tax=Clonostachys solani TaxID=160281 RepID=A0A9N9ZHF8_9HYPO|nr:unnamed protein product [Clonostachys solani]